MTALKISLHLTKSTLPAELERIQAARIQVALQRDPAMISVSVTDNGHGFQLEASSALPVLSDGIGLMGMDERFDLLGGQLEIDSEPGEGARVVAYAPFQEELVEE